MDDRLMAQDDEEMEILVSTAELLSCEKTEENDSAEDNSISSNYHNSVMSMYQEHRMKADADKRAKAKSKKKRKKKKDRTRNNAEYNVLGTYSLQEIIPAYWNQPPDGYHSMRQDYAIPADLKFNPPQESAFFFGRTPSGEYVGRSLFEDGHIAIFGGSGSGKTTSIAMPNFYTWKGTIFSFDFKGDMVARVQRRATKILYLVRGHENRFWYDPFYILHQEEQEDLIQAARELAYAIIPLPHDIDEPFWIEGARNILTGAIVYYYRLGCGFVDAMIEIKTTPIKDLLDKINCDKTASVCLNPDIVLAPKTMAGISMELQNHISVFATDTLIQSAFSSSAGSQKEQIRWEDLEKFNIFIRLDQSRSEQWQGVMRLMLVQLIRTLERRPEKYESMSRRIAPTLLMLDEFPQYGKIDVFPAALKILRSKNVTIAIFCQSLADLDEAYGKITRRTILDNCPYKAILSAFDAETQQYFSALVGTFKTISKGVNITYDSLGQLSSYNLSANELNEPIIHPHEFASLSDIVLLHPKPERFCLVKKETHFRNDSGSRLIEKRR